MYRLILTTGLLILVLSGLPAQDQPDFNTVNAESYRLYLASEWDSVIGIGKLALDADFDYYYLRMRMGIACYQKKNYRKAAQHFRRALELNQGEPAAQEQLYYAELMSGKSELASMTRSEFKGPLADKLPTGKLKFADRLTASYFFQNSLTENERGEAIATFPVTPEGVQYLSRHFSNYSLQLVNYLSPGCSLNHSFNYLSKTNYLYYSNGINNALEDEQHVNQIQYYFSPSFTMRSGLNIRPMAHLLRIYYESPVRINQGVQGGNSALDMETYLENDFVAGLSISKDAGLVDIQSGFWYAELNNARQVQGRAGLNFFPLGNLNLYGGAFINVQYEFSEYDSFLRYIPELQVGFSVAEIIWIDIEASMGEMSQYLEQNGSVVYNSFSDVLRQKLSINLSLPVTKKASLLFMGARWGSHQSSYYALDPANETEISNIRYQSLSIYGGISWKF